MTKKLKLVGILALFLASLMSLSLVVGTDYMTHVADVVSGGSDSWIAQDGWSVGLGSISNFGFWYKSADEGNMLVTLDTSAGDWVFYSSGYGSWQYCDLKGMLEGDNQEPSLLIYGIEIRDRVVYSDVWIDGVSLMLGTNEIVVNGGFEGSFEAYVSIQGWTMGGAEGYGGTVYTYGEGFDPPSDPTPTPYPTASPTATPSPTAAPATPQATPDVSTYKTYLTYIMYGAIVGGFGCLFFAVLVAKKKRDYGGK